LIVAFRSDLIIQWALPRPTHSLDALIWDQWRTGEYWRRHGIQRLRPGTVSRRIASRLDAIKQMDKLEGSRLPWRTIRDSIWDLPKPHSGHAEAEILNHDRNPGARSYAGHSGSLMDEPAKTLKAGAHGVPGGENSLALGGQRLRYFTVRECARLQTFPDEYVFTGPWTSAMRQVGNAVPVLLGKIMAKSIRKHLRHVTDISAQRDSVQPADRYLLQNVG
jgi:DNA (cytosine-5)-methyltransferase 1